MSGSAPDHVDQYQADRTLTDAFEQKTGHAPPHVLAQGLQILEQGVVDSLAKGPLRRDACLAEELPGIGAEQHASGGDVGGATN